MDWLAAPDEFGAWVEMDGPSGAELGEMWQMAAAKGAESMAMSQAIARAHAQAEARARQEDLSAILGSTGASAAQMMGQLIQTNMATMEAGIQSINTSSSLAAQANLAHFANSVLSNVQFPSFQLPNLGGAPNTAASASSTTNGGINWGQVGQGSLTLLGGVGSMIGGAFLAGTTAPTVVGAVIGVTGMIAGATSFGLGMTTIANGFTGGNPVNTPTGSVPQGMAELVGSATGNPNLQIIGSYGDVGVSVLTPPVWGGPLATGSFLLFPPPDFDPNYYYPFDPTK